MIKPHLIFSENKGSFSIFIKNIQKLSVKQIQQFENFASARKGILDFNTYTFSIQKKIKYDEFISLLKHLNIDARCEEHIKVTKTQPRIGFGQYKGMQYGELSDSYMFWLKVNYRGQSRDIIEKELKKRNL